MYLPGLQHSRDESIKLNRPQQLYPAEINPIKTRQKANALSTCSNWLFNFRELSDRLLCFDPNPSPSEPYTPNPERKKLKYGPPVIVMITPIMITNIHWGTYLFFAIVNACFLPLIYFTYPETARRSLEEIDIVFAKGYVENIGYVKAARELEFLTDEEIDRKAREYGLVEEVGAEKQAGTLGVEVEKGEGV